MNKTYDLFLFMGQSNMAGRGIISEQWPETAPNIVRGAGCEYRVISDPGKLCEIVEPFGVCENNPDGIYEPGMKTGSMVTAFVNAYYTKTNMPIIGVSASKGGSSIGQWQGNQDYLTDAIWRLEQTKQYLNSQHISIRHHYMLWCQGETDGDLGTTGKDYKAGFKKMLIQMKKRESNIVF